MKFLYTLSLLSLLLASCSTASEDSATVEVQPVVMTVPYHSATLSYDENLWDEQNGLKLKSDGSCSIDLTGDSTTPVEGWDYEESTEGDMTVYDWAGSASYIAFKLDAETVYGRVGYPAIEPCMEAYRGLVEMNQ